MNPKLRAETIANERVFRFISYILVFLMMACGVMAIGTLIQNVLPGWHSGIIAGVLFFIVIDRLYMYRQMKSLTPLSSEWFINIGTQWLVIALFVRLLLSYANGLDAFLRDLSLFVRGYLETFFSGEFVITLLLAFLVWFLPGQFLQLLDEIGLDPRLALRDDPTYIESEAVPAHQRLVNLTFGLGIALVILTALTRINMDAIFSDPTGIPRLVVSRFSGAEGGALLYFVFGLALLSLSRLMSLHTHWNYQRIPVSSTNLTRQWGIYSLLFLLGLALIVGLLPAGDSLGFFSLLASLLGFVFGVFLFILQLLIIIVMLLVGLPLLLFGKGPQTPVNLPAPFPLPRLPVLPASESANSEVWALIRSVLLWGALAALIVFSLIYFVRQHESILAALRRSRITNWLILAWQWLYSNVSKTRATLAQALADGWQSIVTRLEGKRILPRPGFISLRLLDPRQRIYFFYLAMIRRGAEQGLARKPSQTPAEYAVTLEKALPSEGEDIDSITDAFVQARYSRHDVDSSAADLVRATWGRIRQALQSKRKSK